MKVYVVEVTLRHAIRAEDKDKAIEILKEQYLKLSEDGSLSDLLVFEWDDPIVVDVEDEE